MKLRPVLAALASAALLGVLLVQAPPATAGPGADVIVTTTADGLAVPGQTTLREAVGIVNADVTQERTIVLAVGATYRLTICDGNPNTQEDANASGDLDLLDPEKIWFGDEGTIEQTCPGERVIDSLTAPAVVALSRSRVIGGDSTGDGGGVRVQGDLQMSLWAVLEDNHADGAGGGAWASDDVFVTQSKVRNNTADGAGGGVHAEDGTIIQLASINGNTALSGGGASAGDNMNIVRSTVSGNRALVGGGATAQNSLLVRVATVLANRAGTGANLNSDGSLSITASVVALGSGGPDCDYATATSGGFNVGDDNSCGTNAGTDLDRVHPMLSLLSPGSTFLTQGHRPVAQSPVINRDLNPCFVGSPAEDFTDDQFYNDRPTGPGCDSGAWEEINVRTCTQSFDDVATGHEFFDEICWLNQMDITGGFPDDTFRPANPVTRQSMAAFLFRLAGAPPFPAPASPTFTDVPTSSTFFREIEWLADEDIAAGFPGNKFKPSQAVSRQAMAAFLYRVAGEPLFPDPLVATFPDVPLSSDFFHEIEWLADEGVTGGFTDDTFRPTIAVSRQAMAAFLLRMADEVALDGL